MNEVKNVALNKALAILNALKVQYKVIGGDGTEYGELKVAPPVSDKPKRGSKYGWGTLTNAVKPYIKDLAVGDVAVVPYSEIINDDDLVYATRTQMSTLFGNASWVINRVESGVEVMRIL